MYAHCIRSWRSLGHSRHSPLSSLRGFTLEPLKVLFVCTRTAAVRSARTAVEGTRWSLGCGSSRTLGFLQRSLVVALPFVPWRRIYWRYVVVGPVDVAMPCECLCLSFRFPQRGANWERCYATSINACWSVSPCHAHLASSLSRLVIRVAWVLFEARRNANGMRDVTSSEEACHRGRSGGRGLRGDY